MSDLTTTQNEIFTAMVNESPFEKRKIAKKLGNSTDNVLVVERPSNFNWPSSMPDVSAIRVGNDFDSSVKSSDLIGYSSWQELHVNPVSGSDGNDGLSWATAKRSIASAVAAANASGLDTVVFCKGGIYSRSRSFTASSIFNIDVNMAFIAVYGRVEIGPFEEKTWTQNATYSNVYETTQAGVQQVLNPQIRTRGGKFAENYPTVASLADCAAQAGAIYYDTATSTLYANPHNGGPVDDSKARVFRNTRNMSFNANNNDVYVYGFDFQGGSTGCVNVLDGSTNKIILDNCTLDSALSGALDSTLSEVDNAQIFDCGLFAAFNTESSYSSKDGFNVHERNAVIPSALFVNCTSYNNGQKLSSTQSCNGITLHDGIKAIVIGGECLGSVGTNCGHVNDNTEVWHVGVTAGNSEGDEINGGSIDWGAFGVWSGASTMWLDYCTDVGASIGIYAGVGATAYVRNHNGTGARVGNVVSY